MNRNNVVIALDFDGTVTANNYPELGEPLPNCISVLKQLSKIGNLVVWTCRDKFYEKDIIAWFAKHDIAIAGVNSNPFRQFKSDSPKMYYDLLIDDKAFGIPLDDNGNVDWYELEKWFLTGEVRFPVMDFT
jgi:hypothetical protein